jgi:L-Lysine epsilon oxidase N-terminal/L-lysine epsilon oxidase C-terminal domain
MTTDIIKIFPSIGIARLGNSPPDWPVDRDDKGEWFVGPELPGDHTPPSGGYKDSKFRVKRQAARFRLFGYETGSSDAKEITLADADVKWTVELANTKADWHKFGGVENTNLPLRNASITGANRASLRITPGPRTLDSTEPINERFEHPTKAFNSGAFHGIPVPLGEMQTDADGHLLVLGGFGNSASPHNTPILHFANNDDWYDDVSDGPVNASVRLKGTNTWIQASSAWVICAPPNFVPPIEHIITLYDTLLQVAVDKRIHGAVELLPADIPSFSKDIYPLLARAMSMKWVSLLAGVMHPTIQKIMPLPGSDIQDQRNARNDIFRRLRNPSTGPHIRIAWQDMPKIWSDVYDTNNNVSEALTKIQYRILQQWRDGEFSNDWRNPPAPETGITPEGLTRAALETCIGGALYPGIETSYMTRDNYAFVEPFRLDAAQLMPGDLTKQMAVPWQADFFDCAYDEPLQWWPAHRPDDVFPIGGGPQVPWIREGDNIHNAEDLIQNWHKLGFVIQRGDQYFETERVA